MIDISDNLCRTHEFCEAEQSTASSRAGPIRPASAGDVSTTPISGFSRIDLGSGVGNHELGRRYGQAAEEGRLQPP